MEDYLHSDLPLPTLSAQELARLQWEDYDLAAKEREEEKLEARRENKQYLIEAWEEHVSWYESSFTGPTLEQSIETAHPEAIATQNTGLDPDGTRLPQSDSSEHFDEIVVTGSRNPQPEPFLTRAPQSASSDDLEEVLVTGSRIPPYLPTTTLEIVPWSPDRPYLKALRGLCFKQLEEKYYEVAEEYGDKPAFFLEVADLAFECGDRMFAQDIILSALELPLAGNETTVTVADGLVNFGFIKTAIGLYEQNARLDPDQPQAWRYLAQAYVTLSKATNGNRVETIRALERALSFYDQIIREPIAEVYDGLQLISIVEANAIISRLTTFNVEQDILNAQFVYPMELDLRFVLTWNYDEVDMDLKVTEPSGEKVSYKNSNSSWGGHLSDDMTSGFGPEQYLIRNAQPGDYEAAIDYFSENVLNPNGAVVARILAYRNWGRENQDHTQTKVEFTSDTEEERSVIKVSVD